MRAAAAAGRVVVSAAPVCATCSTAFSGWPGSHACRPRGRELWHKGPRMRQSSAPRKPLGVEVLAGAIRRRLVFQISEIACTNALLRCSKCFLASLGCASLPLRLDDAHGPEARLQVGEP